MPKRTNAFQALVARIFKVRDEEGSVVVESATVSEAGTDTPAEIDILITRKSHGTTIRIAVECRDHARPQSVAWMRELANKRTSMSVDVVIAVSTSGFTRTARKKADQAGIRLLTLEEANAANWKADFLGIDIMQAEFSLRFNHVSVLLEGPNPQNVVLAGDTPIIAANGDQLSTLNGFTSRMLVRRPYDPRKALRAATESNKTVYDLKDGVPTAQVMTPDFPCFMLGQRVIGFVFHYVLGLSLAPIALDRFHLGEAHVDHGVVSDGATRVSIAAVQWKDQTDRIAISVEEVDPRTGAGERLTRKGQAPSSPD